MITSPQLARCRRHRSPLIADRSASALVLGAPSGPPLRYFSLFLTLSLSHWNEKMKWNFCRSYIGHRRSQIVLPLLWCSGARCSLRQSGPPSRFFSLTLSQSLSLYLTEIKKWNEIFADRRSVIGDCKSLCLCSGAAVLVAPSGSPALPQGFSLWLSLSLSLSISLNDWMKKLKWNLWFIKSLFESLYSLTLIAYL